MLVAGMIVGTVFTLFVVPVFYALIAAEHRPDEAREDAPLPSARRPQLFDADISVAS